MCASLVRLLPSSLSLLWSLLIDCFPHSRQPTASWLAYVANLLLLTDYCPTLRERALTAITERLTQLDVEVTAAQQQQQQGRSTANNETADGMVTLLDPKLLDTDEVRRLDALLCILMQYLSGLQQPQQSASGLDVASSASATATATVDSGVQSAAVGGALSDEVFFSLLRVFSVSILPTHRVQLVPFVLFYVCSLSHTYAESFLRWLLERAFDEAVQPALRVSCVSYVQSFVARAAFLRHVSVALTFRHMLEWTAQLSEYTEVQWRQQFAGEGPHAAVPAVGPLDAPQFSVFYSCFQCVLYIFAYRGRQFEAEMDAHAEHDDDDDDDGEAEGEDDVEDKQREAFNLTLKDDGLGWWQDGGGWQQLADKQSSVSSSPASSSSSSSPSSARVSFTRPRPRYSGSLTRSRMRVLVSSMVLSPLQPLRYCLPAVVQQFSRMARDMDIVDLRPVLRSMKRSASSSISHLLHRASATASTTATSGSSSSVHVSHSSLNNGSGLLGYTAASQLAFNNEGSGVSQQMLAYFPFDPYFLNHSAALIAPLYTFAPPADSSSNSLQTHVAGKRKSELAAEAIPRRSGEKERRAALVVTARPRVETADDSSESDDSGSKKKRADHTRHKRREGVAATALSAQSIAERYGFQQPPSKHPTTERMHSGRAAQHKREEHIRQQNGQTEQRRQHNTEEEISEEKEEDERADEEDEEEEVAAASLLSYSPGFGPTLVGVHGSVVSPYVVAEHTSVSPLVHLSPPAASSAARRASSSSSAFMLLSPLPPSALRRSAGGQPNNSASLLSRDRASGAVLPHVILRSMPAR